MGTLSEAAGKQIHTNLDYLRCPKCYAPLTTNKGRNWHQCTVGKPKPKLVN